MMSLFQSMTPESAPPESQPLLKEVERTLGFIPNLYSHLAAVPHALKGYVALYSQFEKTSLTPVERQVVMLAASVENADEFCVAAHSHVATHLVGMEPKLLEQLRSGGPLSDSRLDALATFTREIVRLRGWAQDMPLAAFLGAGFTLQQALEVTLGVTAKTLSNYANHLMRTELNPSLADVKWKPTREPNRFPAFNGRGQSDRG